MSIAFVSYTFGYNLISYI